MKYVVIAVAFLIFGCGEANWAPESPEPCETYQGNYIHTTIKCGDYYDDTIIMCDENSNYDRGSDCFKKSDFYEIISDNKPCDNCGCVTKNICENKT